MTKQECLTILALLLTLWIGLECGYRIRKNGEGPRSYAARANSYKQGFDACQEQF